MGVVLFTCRVFVRGTGIGVVLFMRRVCVHVALRHAQHFEMLAHQRIFENRSCHSRLGKSFLLLLFYFFRRFADVLLILRQDPVSKFN